MATISKPKPITDGLVDLHRESALHLVNRVKYTSKGSLTIPICTLYICYLIADPPGDSFIQGFDAHIMEAFPKLEQRLPKSSWARGDIIEIQGPAASGKTHLLYFWAMTCVLPYRLFVTGGDQEKKEVLVGGRNKSVIVCDCDGRWSLRRFNTIITSYLRDRLATITSEEDPPGTYGYIISPAVTNALKRVHVFRPSSTLALATTLMAIPTYHRTQMADEQVGMLMVDGVSSFHWTDRWLSEQMENTEPTGVRSGAPQPPLPPPLRSDTNPLRHVLTVILNLRRSLGMVTLLTNWGLTSLDSQLPSSTAYFRQHLRAPYPSPFEAEPRTSKLPLTHHVTVPSQGPEPFGEDVSLEDAVRDDEHEERVRNMRLRGVVRTIGKRPGEARTVVESEFECEIGDFDCLGYAHAVKEYPSPSPEESTRPDSEVDPSDAIQSSTNVACLPGSAFVPLVSFLGQDIQPNMLSLAHSHKRPLSIPKSPQLDPIQRGNMVDLIISQHARLADRASFRPFPFSLTKVVAARARSSNIILTTMYIGARIIQALLDNTNWHGYVGWIDSFHRQISETLPDTEDADMTHLADRLSALQDLSAFVPMLLNSSSGYLLLRQGVPIFLKLATKYPQVWTQDSAISISHALNPTRHEMARFVLLDIISSLVFGTVPFLNYDTTLHEDELENGMDGFLERMYSCPVIILVLLARINSARIARITNQDCPDSGDIQDIESRVMNWNPTIDYTDEPAELVARLAVQECWRQAALAYTYMGMCGVDSADERIQHLVSQVAQLASTIEAGAPLEAHLFIPCLIVGVAARKEKHRAILRRKLLASQNVDARLLKGSDFIPVLDHLWHGVAAGGDPVTWEDYVTSRYATMPIDA
ncbi:fungal zn(2)-cys(6) binuclear cluster domain protein [Rhizoctonia solani AG-3 Rhs1AP]|uniref:Fungal zn(2)-cys(6) binuclear cluster domain protein n=1 Tax=Rhizoctonia solani AG-3 Rhs1AP TaxID=1086054 RepID=X8IYD7_9AGAM|nr:fungal zn(2)-cys(6) binuclear cluster domain protein [Rhizoctonia solani AG-3 Rhs1AP]